MKPRAGASLEFAGVSPREAASLARQGVKEPEDLLFWLPRWHVCRARLRGFAQAREGRRDYYLAKVGGVGVFSRGRLHVLKLLLEDDAGGRAQLFYFNRPYLIKEYPKGRRVLLFDTPERTPSGIRFSGRAGTCEPIGEDDYAALSSDRMLVFYRATTVISQQRAREIARAALREGISRIEEPLPSQVRERNQLISLADAVRKAHQPEGWAEWEAARRRVVFDQLFLLQVALARSKIALAGVRKERRYTLSGEGLAKMRSLLPFRLTRSQEKVLGEILGDLAKPSPMNRLLQGDVGSGKTVVAAAAIAATIDSGYQGAVMAPTEILAEQHFHTFRRLLEPAGVKVGMLASGQSRGEKRQVQMGLEGGYFDLVVGTHALIEDRVSVPKLGLAVIDERHKFGVRQRAKLEGKGAHPDLLMMTATPLPRALVLTQYGDTSLSLMEEMPPGRGGTVTKWMHGAMQREQAYRIVEERMRRGERAFAVFPLVQKSEHLQLRDATKEYERLKGRFSGVKVGLIHGKMPSSQKEEIMREFSEGRVSLLVSTTVVEVGIDVPDATVMLIEHANRFGLAQLHQLRGRVGRGPRESVCLLVTGGMLTADARERLSTLAKTANGFELAETDLKLRGPGEFFGTRQHGLSDLDYLDLLLDARELEAARSEAEGFLQADPELSGSAGRKVRRALAKRLAKSWGLMRTS